MNNIIKIRIVLWGALAVVTLFLVWQAVVPFGKISYTSDLDGDDYFIQKLTPAERVVMADDEPVRITGDPVYFSLRAPRRFDRAKMTLVYNRRDVRSYVSTGSPIIEAGVLADKTIWRYDLKPVENRTIDQLAMVWDVVREGNTMLLQKEKKFDSVSGFLSKLPPRPEIAIYNYNLSGEFTVPDYASSSKNRALTYSLRGAYEFYTYLGDKENLDFQFSLLDRNENRDKDPADIDLYFKDKLIDSRHLDDDGNTADNGKKSDRRELDFSLAGLPVGVYKLAVRANGDIVTKQITSKQQYLSFISKLALTGENKENITLYTDGTQFHALTDDPAKLQAIKVNGDTLELGETYKQYDMLLKGTTTKIVLERDGVTLAGDGVFSFDRTGLVNPSYKKVNDSLDINGAGIKYVLARYDPPAERDGWKTATAEFDLTSAYRESGAYGFVISIPGLKAEDDVADYIEVEEIKVEVEGKTLWEKLGELRSKN